MYMYTLDIVLTRKLAKESKQLKLNPFRLGNTVLLVYASVRLKI